MLEPRGHDGMYGALLVEPDHPDADLAVLFMHNEGYQHHVRPRHDRAGALGGRQRPVAEREPETTGAPAMSLRAGDGTRRRRRQPVRFESVPAFAYALDRIAPTPTWGPVTVDIAYGGAFYAILPPTAIGLDLRCSPMRAIADAGEEITKAAAKAMPIEHPDEPDLAFLYGTILTDGGDGTASPAATSASSPAAQIDRSPTGSGVTARLALAGGAAASAFGRGAAVRELHRRGLQRQGLARGGPVGRARR